MPSAAHHLATAPDAKSAYSLVRHGACWGVMPSTSPGAVQGEMRNARGKLFDERAVAGLDGFGGDRQGAANVVDDRQPGAFKRRDRGVIAPRIGREANRAGRTGTRP